MTGRPVRPARPAGATPEELAAVLAALGVAPPVSQVPPARPPTGRSPVPEALAVWRYRREAALRHEPTLP